MGLIAEAAENDFRCESGIAGIERLGVLEQKIGGVIAFVDLAEDLEGDLTREGDQVPL